MSLAVLGDALAEPVPGGRFDADDPDDVHVLGAVLDGFGRAWPRYGVAFGSVVPGAVWVEATATCVAITPMFWAMAGTRRELALWATRAGRERAPLPPPEGAVVAGDVEDLRRAAAVLVGPVPRPLDWPCPFRRCRAAVGAECRRQVGSGPHSERAAAAERAARSWHRAVESAACAALGDDVARRAAADAVSRLRFSAAGRAAPSRWRLPSPAEVRAAALGWSA